MKTLLASAALVFGLASAAAAQHSRTEQEFLRFLAEYDQAVASRDIAFLERSLPDDFVFTGASGRKSDRARTLKYFEQERARPSYRTNLLKHDHVQLRVVGDMAVVTNDYTAQTTPIDDSTAVPRTTTGRHTGVFEKRNGRWMVIAEQDTEQAHNDKVMEKEILQAGRLYNELTLRLSGGRSFTDLEAAGQFAALDRLLAEGYTLTSPSGELSTKEDLLESYRTNQVKLDSIEILEQTVRIVDNNTGIETGKVRYVGTTNGARFDVIQRYTATWVLWDDRWQVIAEHESVVAPED
jgi:ketosteroid isomerase-like protein